MAESAEGSFRFNSLRGLNFSSRAAYHLIESNSVGAPYSAPLDTVREHSILVVRVR
jgi:hypothetical protein